jgi:hypothetical protein
MEELTEIYYNLKMGLVSPYKLYLKLNKRIPLKTINEFVEKQESYQKKLQRNCPKQFKPIVVYSANNLCQMDLFDFLYIHIGILNTNTCCAALMFSAEKRTCLPSRKSLIQQKL